MSHADSDPMDAHPMDAHPECQRCARYLTTEEAAAAEAGEGDGLCEACEEHEWHARQEVA